MRYNEAMNQTASSTTGPDTPKKTKVKAWTDLLRGSAFVRNSAVLFAGTMVMNVLNYIFHFVIGRMVSVEAYGEIESLTSLLAIISVPAAAITMVATKYGAAAKAEGSVRASAAVFRYLNRKIAIYGLPLLGVVFLLTPFFKDFLKIESSWPLLFLWVLMFLSFLSAVGTGTLSGWQRFGAVNHSNGWSAAIKLLLAVLFTTLGFGVSGVVGSFLLAGAIGYAVSLFFLRFIFAQGSESDVAGPSDEPDISALKRYVLPAFFAALSITILGNADMVLAKHHLDAATSGEYGALFIVSRTIFFATGVIASVLFAMSAEESHRQGDSFRTFRYAFLLTLVVCAGALVVFSLFPQFILGLLFGQKYLSASHYLGWFALSASLYALANLVLQYLLSIHAVKATRWFLVVSLVETGALYFFGSSLYAIIYTVIVAQLFALAVGFFFVSKRASVQS